MDNFPKRVFLEKARLGKLSIINYPLKKSSQRFFNHQLQFNIGLGDFGFGRYGNGGLIFQCAISNVQ